MSERGWRKTVGRIHSDWPFYSFVVALLALKRLVDPKPRGGSACLLNALNTIQFGMSIRGISVPLSRSTVTTSATNAFGYTWATACPPQAHCSTWDER